MSRPDFNFRYQEDYLSLAEQLHLVAECGKRFPNPLPQHKRTKRSYGVKGRSYTVVFKGNPVTCQLEDIDTFPLLKELLARIGQNQDYVVVQYYPHGGIGIPPHKDKETTPNTSITGISLGWDRWLEMTRYNTQPFLQRLKSGSRYDIDPPTNDYYAHSILEEEDINASGERWSLTARKLP